MKMRFSAALPIALAVTTPITMFCITPASAQVAVFDSNNFGQNLLTAARALEQIDHQITMLQNQATMLSNQAKNLTTFSFPELQQLNITLQKIETLMGQAQTISFTPASLDSEFTRLFPGQGTTTATSSTQLANAQARLTTTLAAYQQTMATQSQITENISADAVTLQTLATRSQSSGGALQVAQATNQLLALTAKQQFQIQQMMAAQGRADATAAATRAQGSIDAQAATKAFLGSGTAYTPD